MEIKIKTLKFDGSEQLSAFVEKKVNRLARFLDDSDLQTVEVTLKNEVDSKHAKIQLHIPGEELVIERNAKTFEDAITASVDAMKEKITRAKEKKADQ